MKNRCEFLIPIALLGFSLLCYASIIPTYFLSDDFVLIGKVARQGMFYQWGESHGGFLRPGTILSYVVDYWVWGLNPIGYHLTNILFHGLTAYAVFLIARHFFRKAQSAMPTLLSFLAACLFVALPCHSESVSWIAGRTDVIAAALGLAATYCFLVVQERRSLFCTGFMLILFAAALLTKESVIVLPALWLVIFIYGWWSRKEAPSIHATISLILSFLMLMGYFLLRRVTIGHFIGGYGTVQHISIINMSSVINLIRYVFRTLLPVLSFFHPRIWLAIGFTVGGLMIIIIVCRKRFQETNWSLITLLVLCYFVSLVPVITMGISMLDTQGERFLYLPSVFACVLVAYFVTVIASRFRAIVLLSLIVIQVFALQGVHKRWITASHICQQVAMEVSQKDPASTVILNVPDNFQGAYVFRNGLNEAATIFMANQTRVPYRLICCHDLNAINMNIETSSDSASVSLTLPYGISFHEVRDHGFDVKREGNSLVVAEGSKANAEIQSFLSFRTASCKPMFQTIEWKHQNAPRGSD